MMTQTLRQKSQRMRRRKTSGWLAVRGKAEVVAVGASAYSFCISSCFGLFFFKVTLTSQAKGNKYK
jgi:hypothetical protein